MSETVFRRGRFPALNVAYIGQDKSVEAGISLDEARARGKTEIKINLFDKVRIDRKIRKR